MKYRSKILTFRKILGTLTVISFLILGTIGQVSYHAEGKEILDLIPGWFLVVTSSVMCLCGPVWFILYLKTDK